MINIKCKNCKAVFQVFNEIEEAEQRIKEIEKENNEPRKLYFRAKNYCDVCVSTKFFIDEEEFLKNLNRQNNVEIIVRTLITCEITITKEVKQALSDLACEANADIEQIINRCENMSNSELKQEEEYHKGIEDREKE